MRWPESIVRWWGVLLRTDSRCAPPEVLAIRKVFGEHHVTVERATGLYDGGVPVRDLVALRRAHRGAHHVGGDLLDREAQE